MGPMVACRDARLTATPLQHRAHSNALAAWFGCVVSYTTSGAETSRFFRARGAGAKSAMHHCLVGAGVLFGETFSNTILQRAVLGFYNLRCLNANKMAIKQLKHRINRYS